MSERYGPPEVVRVVDDAPVPWVGADDVLVRVHATTVNRTDCGYRGRVAVLHPRHLRRAAAACRRLGHGVSPGSSSGWAVRSRGSPRGTRSSGMPRGGSARTPSTSRSSVTSLVAPGAGRRRPPHRCGGDRGRALRAVRDPARRHRPGQRVLVHGATGAIGSACVQLLADLGVHVDRDGVRPRTSSSSRRLGAEHVIDHETVGLHPHRARRSMPSSTWWARAPSGRAGGSSCPAGSTCRPTSGRSRRTSRCRS